jgi:hypothetical protein
MKLTNQSHDSFWKSVLDIALPSLVLGAVALVIIFATIAVS